MTDAETEPKGTTEPRVLVFTAVFGHYDRLRPQPRQTVPCDFVAYSDEDVEAPPPWHLHQATGVQSRGPRFNARRIKILGPPSKIKGSYSHYVWLDANVEIISADFIGHVIDIADSIEGVAAWTHATRRCVYDEVEECIQERKGDPRALSRQAERYQQEGFPAGHGLYATCVLVRRCGVEAIRSLNERWWAEIETASLRDQVSFPYAAWQEGVAIAELPLSAYPGQDAIIDRAANYLRRSPGIRRAARAIGIRRQEESVAARSPNSWITVHSHARNENA